MEDTSSIIERVAAEAATVEDHEPIPGDESPDASAEEAPVAAADGAEAPAAEAAPEGGAPAAPAAPQKRRGPIPFDRHQAVLTKARNEAKAAQEALEKQIADYRSRYETSDHQAQLQLLDLLQTDPGRAVTILKQVDPERFGKLTWAEQQQVAAAVSESIASGGQPAGDPGPKPTPDTLNPDGTMGYSAEAAEKLVEWRIAKERQEYQKELKSLRDEISPIKSEREAREAYSQSLTKMGKRLEEARATWPEFTTYEKDMRAALEANPTWGLEEAYRAVVTPKLVANREAIRAEERKKVIEELNAKGRAGRALAPGQQPAAAAAADSGAPRSTADIIRETLRSAQAA